jgi:hypothetical protein
MLLKFYFISACYFVFLLLIAAMPALVAAENWTPAILESEEYLPDYSYAGYFWGEKPLPVLDATINVTEFGAIPNDGKDDTDLIRTALKATKEIPGPVVLRFPVGKFLVRDILYIERSNLVLQGAGSGSNGTIFSVSSPHFSPGGGMIA